MNKNCRLMAASVAYSASAHPDPIFRIAWHKALRSITQSWRILSMVLLAGLLMFAPPSKPSTDVQWSGLGHGKRYLRINEYLFNGLQKVTAIAWQTDADPSEKLPT